MTCEYTWPNHLLGSDKAAVGALLGAAQAAWGRGLWPQQALHPFAPHTGHSGAEPRLSHPHHRAAAAGKSGQLDACQGRCRGLESALSITWG